MLKTTCRSCFEIAETSFSGMFWTAPEHLSTGGIMKSKKGDTYSFGVILFELLYRTQPYDTFDVTPKGILCAFWSNICRQVILHIKSITNDTL